MLANYVLVVTGVEAKYACRMEQICSGLESGIKGGIHVVRLVWKQHSQKDNWCFLIIGARNEFNKDNQIAMLWAAQFEFPSGAWFAFNCYRHWATLAIRACDGTGNFLFSKKGVTEGETLTMVEYGLGILPLIRELRKVHSDITWICYTDDAGSGGIFEGIRRHMNEFMARGPPARLPPLANQEHLGRVSLESPVVGGLYLGIQTTYSDRKPLPRGLHGFQGRSGLLAGGEGGRLVGVGGYLGRVERWHLHTAYAVLNKSLQQKWAFVQCATPDIGMAFQVVEDALRNTFLPALFQGAMSQIPGRAITGMPVKLAGISLPDPTRTAGEKCRASCVITEHHVAALCGTGKFRSGNHVLLMWEGRGDI